jgi:hypothetical protein
LSEIGLYLIYTPFWELLLQSSSWRVAIMGILKMDDAQNNIGIVNLLSQIFRHSSPYLTLQLYSDNFIWHLTYLRSLYKTLKVIQS